jgi:acyl CoA:acetate/3-ketoacid CoA transferase
MTTRQDRAPGLDNATALIRDGDTIRTSGFVGIGLPDALLTALDRRFLSTGSPRDGRLTLPVVAIHDLADAATAMRAAEASGREGEVLLVGWASSQMRP